MTMTLQQLSTGPVLTKHEQGVHIIFASSEALQESQIDAAAATLTSASPIPIAVTDIIVFGQQPWHMVNGRLEKHPEVHTSFQQTVLKLLPERGETAVWWSEEHFTITAITPDPHSHTPNPTPLLRPFDPPDTRPGNDHSGQPIHIAKSARPSDDSRKHEFKIAFTRDNGLPIDPNMKCL